MAIKTPLVTKGSSDYGQISRKVGMGTAVRNTIRYSVLQTSIFTLKVGDGIKTPDSMFMLFCYQDFICIYDSEVFTFINY